MLDTNTKMLANPNCAGIELACFCQSPRCEVLFESLTAREASHAGVHKLMDPSAEAALGGIFLEAGVSMQDPPSPVDVQSDHPMPLQNP